MKLGAYKINNIPVSEMTSVNVADLKGKEPYLIAEKMPSGYKDISTIENMHLYGRALVGSTRYFMDWKCLQREIKILTLEKVKNDLNNNWNKLTLNEKLIVCNYMLSKIPPAIFSALVPDASERSKIAMQYDLNNRTARGNYSNGTGRIQAVRLYLFDKLGATSALEVLSEIVKDGLFQLYEGGTEGTEESGQVGINDYFLARKKTPYTNTGLKKQKYKVVDGSEDTIKEVADNLAEIINNGNY
jgi:hypothetical protein